MKNKILLALLIVMGSQSVFASYDCKKLQGPFADLKCYFLEVLTNDSNKEIVAAKKLLESQGFSHVNSGEEPLGPVFIQGKDNRYFYLMTTDVSPNNPQGFEFNSIGVIISLKIGENSPDFKVEKVITNGLFQ